MANNKTNYFGSIILAGISLFPSCASTPLSRLESKVNVSVDKQVNGVEYSSTVKNMYLARIGAVFVNEPVVQNSLTYTNENIPGWSFNYWDNHKLNGQPTEMDLTLRYSGSNDDVNYSVKGDRVFLRDFTNFHDALELGGDISTKNLPVTLGAELDFIYSPDNSKTTGGFEGILSAGKQFSIMDGLTAGVTGDLHFNNHYFTNSDRLSIANMGVGVNWDLLGTGLLSMGLDAKRQFSLSDDFDNQTVYGFTVGGSVHF